MAKLDSTKIKNVSSLKDISNKVKKKPMEQEEIYANHVSDKGLIWIEYKKILKLSNNTIKQLI